MKRAGFTLLLLSFNLHVASTFAQGTAFTYQGRLNVSGSAANGLYDFRFRLAGDPLANNYVGNPYLTNGVGVSNGLFTTTMDFGNVFTGSNYWLEVDVRASGGGSYTVLSPLQAVNPTPYSLYAASAGSVAGLTIQPNSSGAPNVIGGASVNFVLSGVLAATIAGGGAPSISGQSLSNSVLASFGTVGGGANNIASNVLATISGGYSNAASGFDTTISGGSQNIASGLSATVGGGDINTASGQESTVGGGANNTASSTWATIAGGSYNQATEAYTAIGAGYRNIASGFASVVCGGYSNTASATYTTVTGGFSNICNAQNATLSGGGQNLASGQYATVSGGYTNIASGNYSSVIGGSQNMVTGQYSAALGGINNQVTGAFSCAAGSNARCANNGSFVWGDPIGQFFSSTADNQFSVRATGGVRFVSASSGGTPTAGVSLAPGGGSWSSLSDREAKENFQLVNGRTILQAIAALPVTTWNYKTQDKGIRHIGPMAQDFYAAFAVGEDERHITEVDEGGIALAAIQGLNEKVDEKDAQIKSLKEQNDLMAVRLRNLEQMVQTLAGEK